MNSILKYSPYHKHFNLRTLKQVTEKELNIGMYLDIMKDIISKHTYTMKTLPNDLKELLTPK